MSIQSDLEQAISRLPELEWKLTGLGVIKSHLLPRGLFKDQIEPSPQSCINEIKSDLQRLQSHPEGQEGSYLVNKIYRKVNVLVRICHEHERKNVKAPAAAFLVDSICTRQKWVVKLETEITTMKGQKRALELQLERLLRAGNDVEINKMRHDIGLLSEKITKATEQLAQATHRL